MQTKIKNREALLSHGDVESRRIVLDIAEKTLQHLDALARAGWPRPVLGNLPARPLR